MIAPLLATVLAALGTPNEWPYVAAAYLAVFVGIGAFTLRTVILSRRVGWKLAAGEASMDVTEAPDDRDLDEGGLDLTPRTDRPVRRARKGNRWMAVGVLVVLLFGAGFIVKQALGNATLFYLNADEAVAQKADLGQKQFRLQGIVSTPFENLGADNGEPLIFEVQYDGAKVLVHHNGAEPPPLSKPGLPVVLEGHWAPNGKWFDSERLLVKHTEDYEAEDKGDEYEEQHPDRVKEASENAAEQ